MQEDTAIHQMYLAYFKTLRVPILSAVLRTSNHNVPPALYLRNINQYDSQVRNLRTLR